MTLAHGFLRDRCADCANEKLEALRGAREGAVAARKMPAFYLLGIVEPQPFGQFLVVGAKIG